MPLISDIWHDFISIIYPEPCLGCGDILYHNEHILCLKCNLSLPKTDFENIPNNPVERLFWFKVPIEAAASGYFFVKDGIIQNLIHSLKYRENKVAGILLGQKLGRSLKNSSRFKNIDYIVPVPLHKKKLRIRGFNQAAVIAEGMSSEMNIPVLKNALIRNIHTDSQTRKGVFDRWGNVRSIFKVSDEALLKNKHILVVDDVITSGSTIESCASAILPVDGAKVSLASVAIAAD